MIDETDVSVTSENPSITGITSPAEPWLPSLSPRQREIYFNRSRILLVDGPRFSGKSIVLSHKTIQRAWEIHECNIGIFVSSYKVATDGGVWVDVIDAAKEWENAGIVSEYGVEFSILTTDSSGEGGSKVDAKNRTPYLKIRNKWGTESVIRLFSIDNENEIEQKTKGLRFQFMWIVEGSNFKSSKVLMLCEDQLRTKYNPFTNAHMPDSELQLAMDTNPAEEGKKHWIYKMFYVHDNENIPEEYRAQVAAFRAQMDTQFLGLDDNPFLPQSKKDSLIGKYAGDPHNFKRFVLGEWPEGGNAKSLLFADVFTRELLVDDCVDVHELTDELFSGWDIGPVNKAVVLLEKRIVDGVKVWCVLDEIIHVPNQNSGPDDYVSTEMFTIMVLEKMAAIDKHYRERRVNFNGFKWTHWSDSSSWIPNDKGETEAMDVYNASGGQIELRPVDKPAKSVEAGCQILRKLMREFRFFMGNNTPQLLNSVENIRRPSKGNKTIDPGDPLKHPIDALRYPIYAESIDDLLADPIKPKSRDNRTVIHAAC